MNNLRFSKLVSSKLSFDPESDLRHIRHVMDQIETFQNLSKNKEEINQIS